MIKAIGYIRVSTDQQDFERQRQEIVEYAKRNNFLVLKIFEDKHTGSEYEERAGFQDLLTYLSDFPEVKVVIFDEVSRMGRDTAHQVITYKQLSKRGIRIYTRGKGEFGNNKEDSLLFTVLSAIADYEKQTIIDRTSSGRRKVVKDGFTQTSQSPYGYDLILTQKKDRQVNKRQSIEIRQHEAPHVKEMFRIIDEGGTVYDIIKYFKSHAIRPRKGGLSWGKSSILRILHSTTYYGEWKFGKMVKNGKTKYSLSKRKSEDLITVKVPEIISKELFDRVQTKLYARKHELNPKNQKHIYLLKGITHCNCNHAISCYFEERTKTRIYRCPQRNVNGVIDKTCQIKSINADYIEKLLLIELRKKMSDSKFFEQVRKEELKNNQKPILSTEENIKTLERKIIQNDSLLKSYFEKSMSLVAENAEKAQIFEKMADDLLIVNKNHRVELDKLKSNYESQKKTVIDFDQLKTVRKALLAMSEQEIHDFNDNDQEGKVQFVRKYIKEVKLMYRPVETVRLRSVIAKTRNEGIYKAENKHLKELYLTVFNKNHEIRAKSAIQVLSMDVSFVNNYTLPIEFIYFHEKPDLAVSYIADDKSLIL